MICTKCKRDLDLDGFYRRATSTGYRQPCKRCTTLREGARYHRSKDPERTISLSVVLRLKYPEESIEQCINRLHRLPRSKVVKLATECGVVGKNSE